MGKGSLYGFVSWFQLAKKKKKKTGKKKGKITKEGKEKKITIPEPKRLELRLLLYIKELLKVL